MKAYFTPLAKLMMGALIIFSFSTSTVHGQIVNATASNGGPVCNGDDVTLQAGQVGTAVGALSYSWSGPGGFTSSAQNPTVSPAVDGVYTVTVTEVGNGDYVRTTDVIVNPFPTVSFTGLDLTYCVYDTCDELTVSPLGGVLDWERATLIPASDTLDSTWFCPSVGADVYDVKYVYSEYYNNTNITIFEDGFSGGGLGWTGLAGAAEWEIGATSECSSCPGTPGPATDATAANNDNFILGTDIGGAYDANLTETYWVESPTINCKGYTEVTVAFQRWNGYGLTDEMIIQVYDGSAWQQVWTNGQKFGDGSWNGVSYYVGTHGDNNANFKVRFGMGKTNGSDNYTGWNIDDVLVTGTRLMSCSDSVTMSTTVWAPPVAEIDRADTICAGECKTLTALPGGMTYLWGDGTTNNTINACPTADSTFYLTVTNAAGCTDTDDAFIKVNDIPVVDATAADDTICIGDTTTLTADPAAGVTYAWNTAPVQTTRSIDVWPVVTTTYIVTVTNAAGCTDTEDVVVTVNALPPVSADTAQTICEGICVDLLATGADTYEWAGGPLTALYNVCPAVTETFVVTGTDANGCSNTDDVIITVIPAPDVTITPDKDTICEGDNVTLVASNANTYVWDDGSTANPRIASPAVTTTYHVTGTDATGCTGRDTVIIVVNLKPTVNAATARDTICSGDSVQISATGALTYVWNQSLGAGASHWVKPTSATTYTVTGTDAVGCTNTDEVVVVVVSSPVADAGPDQDICPGDTATLTVLPGAGVTYAWNDLVNSVTGPNSTIQSIQVFPTVTTTYIVTVENAGGCTDADTVIVTLNPAPVAVILPDTTICANSPVTLTALPAAGVTYQWSTPPGGTNPTIDITPAVTTTYSVTVTNAGGCSDRDTAVVIVTPAPTVIALPSDTTICEGAAAPLRVSGATTYTWNTQTTLDDSLSANPIATPTVTTTYFVTGTDGCTAVDTAIVQVNAIPVADILPSDTSICPGSCVDLTAKPDAATSYSWSTSPIQTTQIINVCPTTTTTYSVTVTNGANCSDRDTAIVNMFAVDTVFAGNDTYSCNGDPVDLTASNTVSYVWSDGIPPLTNAIVTVNPVVITTYIVTGTDANGCTSTDDVVVDINSFSGCPISCTDPDFLVCRGTSIGLSVACGTSYSWSTGGTGNAVMVTVNSDTTYTVTITDANGCTASDNIVITTYPDPPVNIVGGDTLDICVMGSAVLSATGAGVGGSYAWNVGTPPPTFGAVILAWPLIEGLHTYIVTGTDAIGCTSVDSIFLNEVGMEVIITPDVATICSGDSVELMAVGGNQWVWSGGLISSNIVTVKPTTTTTYVVTATDIVIPNCSATDTVIVNVVAPPPADAGGDTTICEGSCIDLIASGGITYLWGANAGNSANDTVTVCPTSTTTYYVTVTDGCETVDTVIVTVLPAPLVDAGDPATVCVGGCIMLKATGAVSYDWGGGATTDTNTVCPAVTTDYVVTGTGVNLCEAMDTVTVSIGAVVASIPIISPNDTICGGDIVQLEAMGGSVYTWNDPTPTTLSPINVYNPEAYPIATTTYTVTVGDGSGCTDTEDVIIFVTPSPDATINGRDSICNLECEDLIVANAGGGAVYNWNSGGATTTENVCPTTDSIFSITITNSSGCSASDDITVRVGAIPTAEAGPNVNLCNGEDTLLTATGAGVGGSYVWGAPLGATTNTVTVSPVVTVVYNVTVTTAFGCTDDDNISVFVLTPPVADAGDDTSVCLNDSIQLDGGPSAGVTYSWSPASLMDDFTSRTPWVKPLVDTVFILTVDNGSCIDTDDVIVTVNTIPNVNASVIPDTICVGETAVLSATGALSYVWTPPADLQTPNNQTTNADPIVTTSYTVVGTDINGCIDDDFVILTVEPIPTAAILPTPDTTICLGDSATLRASGGGTYSWSPGGETSPIINVGPIITTVYTLTVTNAAGCTDTETVTVNIVDTPNVVITVTEDTICVGETTDLTATGAGGGGVYNWSTGDLNNNAITVAPTADSVFTVTAVNSNGCNATADTLIKVYPIPVSGAGNDTDICLGDTATLTATGGGTYRWSEGFQTTASIQVWPTVTTTYTVTVTNTLGGCTDTDEVIVIINALPAADAGADTTICMNDSVKIGATGGGNYIWDANAGNSTNDSVYVTPAVLTVYIVTVTNDSGCVDTDDVIVSLNALPNALIVFDDTICYGDTVELVAQPGAMPDYDWGGGVTDQIIRMAPVADSLFIVSITDGNGCVGIDSATVIVNDTPTVNIYAQNETICDGDSDSLIASGGTIYNWAPDGETNDSIIVTPAVTTIYVVTVENANGCINEDSITIVVNNLPTLSATNDTACLGFNDTLIATGGDTYLWSDAAGANDTVIVSPATSKTYTVTVTDANGCSATDEATAVINQLPVIGKTGDHGVCNGGNTILTASGGDDYMWSAGTPANTASINVAVAGAINDSTSYYVTVTDSDGCENNDSVIVWVSATLDPPPMSDTSVCLNDSVQLFSGGGTWYDWTPGTSVTPQSDSIIASPYVNPTATTTYVVEVRNAICTGWDTVIVAVNPLPTAFASTSDGAICRGDTVTLSATPGAGTPPYNFLWAADSTLLDAATDQNPDASPYDNETYLLEITDDNGCIATDDTTVLVNDLPAGAVNNATICVGDSAKLIANGGAGATYQWDAGTPSNIDSIIVAPIVTTTYTVTITSPDGCLIIEEAVVTVNPLPNISITPGDTNLCVGYNLDLLATGGDSYLWSTTQNIAAITVSPTTDSLFIVTGTDGNGCENYDTTSVTIENLPTITLTDDSVCLGACTDLIVSGGASYSWVTPVPSSNDTVTACPGVTTTYVVTVTGANTCTATEDAIVRVDPIPVAAVENDTICINDLATLTATGGSSYVWNNGPTTQIINPSPPADSVYVVTVFNSFGCTDDEDAIVVVKPLPIVTIVEDFDTICLGDTVILTATGGVLGYVWSTGGITNTVTVVPTTDTTIFVTATSADTCDNVASIFIKVNSLPVVVVSSDTAVCLNSSANLTASGGTAYAWSTTEITPAIVVTPIVDSTFIVTVTDGNQCSDTASVDVTVYALPTAAILPNDTIMCLEETVTLKGSGGTSYSWNTSPILTIPAIVVTPTADSTLILTVTDGNGCQDTEDVFVDINALPTAAILPNDTVMCVGESVTLRGFGGTSYSWNNGPATQDITITPTDDSTVVLTVTDVNGCQDTEDVFVDINALPTVNAGVNDTICFGETSTLNATGTGTSYTWFTPNDNPLLVTPIDDSTFVVTATNGANCTATDDIIVVVNPLPMMCPVADPAICPGGSVDLTACGGGTYLWSPSGETTNVITVSPVGVSGDSAIYKVTVTSTDECVDSAQKVVYIEDDLVVGISNDTAICKNDSAQLIATGGINYAWSPVLGISNAAIANPIAFPTSTTTYTVTVDDGGCTGVDSVIVTVNDLPTAGIAGADSVCTGYTTALSGSGGVSYVWSTLETTQNILITPMVDTNYVITVTDANGCKDDTNKIITANPLPIISISPDHTICQGEQTLINASTPGDADYEWYVCGNPVLLSTNSNYLLFPPGVDGDFTTYCVTVTDANGCSDSEDVIVTIGTDMTVNAGDDDTLCEGDTVQLSAAGGTIFIWTPTTGLSNPNIANPLAYPIATTTYIVTGSTGATCSGKDTVVVIVNPNPTATAFDDEEICYADTTFVRATGGGTYEWFDASTNDTLYVSPLVNTDYIVTVTNSFGCNDMDTASITINPLPTIVMSDDTSICTGESATLTASGGATYAWTDGVNNYNTQTIIVKPTVATTYFVTVTDSKGCSDDSSVVVTVNSLPTACTVPSLIAEVCEGKSIDVTACGGGTYEWSTGETDTTITIFPIGDTTITVTTTDVFGCKDRENLFIAHNLSPNVTIEDDDTICEGETVNLIAYGASTYLWDNTTPGPGIPITPTQNTAVFVVGTDGNGCTDQDTAFILVNDVPQITITGEDTICRGNSTTFSANVSNGTGNFTYEWSPGTGKSRDTIVTPTNIGTYPFTVTVTDTTTCSANAGISLVVESGFAFGITPSGPTTFCENGSVTLSADGAGSGATYVWSKPGETSKEMSITPVVLGNASTTYTYSVTATSTSNCSESDEVVVVVNPNPVLVMSGDAAVCQGGSTKLFAGISNDILCDSIIWSTGKTSKGSCSDTITVTPTGVVGDCTPYTISVTNTLGCSDSGGMQICIDTILVLTAVDDSVCLGECVPLIVSGGVNFLWTANPNDPTLTDPNAATPIVCPAVTTTYSVVADDGVGCTGTEDIIVTVHTPPTLTVSDDVTICRGDDTTICAFTNGTSYLWSELNQTTACITVSPISNTNYSVTVYNDYCSAFGDVNVFVNQPPDVTINGNDSICLNDCSLLIAGGADSYNWSTDEITDQILVCPTTTPTIYVTGTDANQCTDTDEFVLTVMPLPVITILGPDMVCNGAAAPLQAGGGATYNWYQIPSVFSMITPTVDSTTTYCVEVTTSFGCIDTACKQVATVEIPIDIAGDGQSVCSGDTTSLIATSGFISYRWDDPTRLGSPDGFLGTYSLDVEVISDESFVYTVTVTNSNGCTDAEDAVVHVKALPTVGITDDHTICVGGSTNLCANTGLNAYDWRECGTIPQLGTNECLTISPAGVMGDSVIYCVTVTDNNCSNRDDVVVHLDNNLYPNAGQDTAICLGASITLSTGGGTDYIWQPGNLTSNPVTVTPLVTTTYTVTVTDAATLCTGSDDIIVMVNQLPAISVTPELDTICLLESSMLIASGGVTYDWYLNMTDTLSSINDSILVSPDTLSAYFVVGTDANGCKNIDTSVVMVNSLPIITLVVDQSDSSICKNTTATIIASGGVSYLWNNGVTLPANTVGPDVDSTYCVMVTNSNGCTENACMPITVDNTPRAEASATPDSLCFGGTTTLSIVTDYNMPPDSQNTFVWDNDSTTNTIFVNPMDTPGTYIYAVTVTNPNCNCTSRDEVVVVVHPLPVVIASDDDTICFGESTTITTNVTSGTSPFSYWWGAGLNSDPNLIVSPTDDATYIVELTDKYICTDSDTANILVSNPSALIVTDPENGRICADSTANLSVNISGKSYGPYTYSWSPIGGTLSTISVFDPQSDVLVTVSVTDDIRCIATDDAMIYQQITDPIVFHDGAVATDDTICEGTGSYSIGLQSAFDHYIWSSGSFTPSITIYESGDYNVTVTDSIGCKGISDPVNITLISYPVAVLSYYVHDESLKVDFFNNSVNTDSSSWHYGDGGTFADTVLKDTSHTYGVDGSYTVFLYATNACGTDVDSASITVYLIGIKEKLEEEYKLLVFPNPTRDNLSVLFEIPTPNDVEVVMYNSIGEKVYSDQRKDFQGTYTETIDVQALRKGVYTLQLVTGDKVITRQFVVQ